MEGYYKSDFYYKSESVCSLWIWIWYMNYNAQNPSMEKQRKKRHKTKVPLLTQKNPLGRFYYLHSSKRAMATPLAPSAPTAPHLLHTRSPDSIPTTHHLVADFNYYQDPGDGSGPAPSYVGRPETYERPAETRSMPVHDIRGEEDRYTLDGNGFQIFRHASQEVAFEDGVEIERVYYPEIEGILKSA